MGVRSCMGEIRVVRRTRVLAVTNRPNGADRTDMPLKFALVDLDDDCPRIRVFERREVFREQCKLNENAQVPYCSFERRMRKGRWLWHPTETRFFDPNGK